MGERRKAQKKKKYMVLKGDSLFFFNKNKGRSIKGSEEGSALSAVLDQETEAGSKAGETRENI